MDGPETIEGGAVRAGTANKARSTRQSWWLPGMLAFRDLKDEALLSICLVSAIAAVLAPIMVLAGLKFGFIEILRDRLIQDPGFRRISPVEAQTRPESFFKKLAARPDIAFVQPNISFSGTTARLESTKPGTKLGDSFDIMPTAPGDPLVGEHGGTVPEGDEATLTRSAAAALEVAAGDEIRLVVTRVIGGRREVQNVPLKVRSVLRAAADPERRAYVPLGLVQDVERFRSGIPVVTRKWLGLAAPPLQSFDGVFVLLAEELNEGDVLELATRNGTIGKVVSPEEFEQLTGLAAPDEAAQIVQLVNTNKPVRGQQVAATRTYLGERKAWILPTVRDLAVSLDDGSEPHKVRTFHPDGFKVELAEGSTERWRPWRVAMSFAQVDRVLLPKALAEAKGIKSGDALQLKVLPGSPEDATQGLVMRVVADGTVAGDSFVLHPALAGMLRESRSVRLRFEETLSDLVADDPGFRDFRAYGRTIDDIPGIVRDLQKDGVEVRAKSDIIEQLQRLDTALTWITLIVAAVALLGGSAVLIASFYAAVERKKGELSLLRLLGFSKGGIFSMPIQQSLMLAGAGFLLALALFQAFAALINTYFATDLTVTGNICRLEASHLAIFAAATLVIAVLSSLLAARQTLLIDPAEALRQE